MHPTTTSDRPQTNAFVEREIRTMLEGTRASLLLAELLSRFRPIAGRHHTFAIAIFGESDGEAGMWVSR